MRQDIDLSSLGTITPLLDLEHTPPPVKFEFGNLPGQTAASYNDHPTVKEGVRSYWQYDMGGPS